MVGHGLTWLTTVNVDGLLVFCGWFRPSLEAKLALKLPAATNSVRQLDQLRPYQVSTDVSSRNLFPTISPYFHGSRNCWKSTNLSMAISTVNPWTENTTVVKAWKHSFESAKIGKIFGVKAMGNRCWNHRKLTEDDNLDQSAAKASRYNQCWLRVAKS